MLGCRLHFRTLCAAAHRNLCFRLLQFHLHWLADLDSAHKPTAPAMSCAACQGPSCNALHLGRSPASTHHLHHACSMRRLWLPEVDAGTPNSYSVMHQLDCEHNGVRTQRCCATHPCYAFKRSSHKQCIDQVHSAKLCKHLGPGQLEEGHKFPDPRLHLTHQHECCLTPSMSSILQYQQR